MKIYIKNNNNNNNYQANISKLERGKGFIPFFNYKWDRNALCIHDTIT